MRVLSMTPEQINALPPTERTTYIQIVSFFYTLSLAIVSCAMFLVDDFFPDCREPLWVFRHDEDSSF